MARKTVTIIALLDYANKMLRDSKPELIGQREGIAALLEAMLHETGNYGGFGYIHGWPNDDETRRVYYRKVGT